MGAFLESASQGTRLVPESMSHEESNPIKQSSSPHSRGGVPPRAFAPKGGAQPLVILRVGMGLATPLPNSALISSSQWTPQGPGGMATGRMGG